MEIYGSGGLGFYLSKAESSVTYTGTPGNFHTGSDTDTSLGVYLGLGANVNLSRNVFLGIEGKYFRSEDAAYEVRDVPTTPWYLDLDGIMVTGNIGYRF